MNSRKTERLEREGTERGICVTMLQMGFVKEVRKKLGENFNVHHYMDAQKCIITTVVLKGIITPLFICVITSTREVVSSAQFAFYQFVC